MKSLRQVLADYLETRRALGYKLAGDGQLLQQFVDYIESAGDSLITTPLSPCAANRNGEGM